MEPNKIHDNCFEFLVDFETKKTIPFHIGRLYIGKGHCVRVTFTPQGMKLYIPHEAVEDGSANISASILDSDEIEFAGFKPA